MRFKKGSRHQEKFILTSDNGNSTKMSTQAALQHCTTLEGLKIAEESSLASPLYLNAHVIDDMTINL